MEDIEKGKEGNKIQKSYFDVLGICCPSEIPLIDNILKPLDGVIQVNVIVPSRTVIVIHDNHIISQIQIVKALNSARLEANIRVYGEPKYGKKWPSPYTIGCGILVVISTFKFWFHPLEWVGLAAVVLGIPPIGLRCFAAIRNCTLDVNILVLIAVVGAIILQDFWEAGTVVFLFTIAEWLELRASHKANAVMSSLMSMAPQTAVLAETGQMIDAKDVNIGMILAVKAGEVIPMDGVVVQGKSEVDEKTLTGEPLPVAKDIESTVWAGTININGYISIRTTALAEECMVAKMAKLVEEAQNNKSKTQRLVDQFAKYYTPAVMLASISLVVVPAALRKSDIKHWAHLALVVLVSACPCALILSTPVATFCAFTKAATTGILLKGGDYLEILAKIKFMAFDKTGTLTRGEFSVTHFRSITPDVTLNTLLYWVSSIESKASHPMAAALVDHAHFNSVEPKPESVTEFQNFPGEGIYGIIDGKNVYIGNKRIAIRAGCNTVLPQGDDKDGETFGYIFCEGNLLGLFSMTDTCRSGVLEAINELKSLGIKTAMLTGDSQIAAMRVQDKLGQALDQVHAELLPEDKARIIKNLKIEGPTAMIGDGVNDAPALATADIGISMGISGSALATETGHITLMSNDIRKIPLAIRLARRTVWKVRQNVVLSFVTKAGILTLAFCGHPLLWAAVLADVGTCLLVIMNSMLILHGTNTHNEKHHKHTCAQTNKGRGSHKGCSHPPHNMHACGSKVEHNRPCSHSNHLQEQTCSQGDRSSMCGDKEDQTPRNRSQSPNSSGFGTIHNVKDHNQGFCSSTAHDVPSYVTETNRTDKTAQTCENCSSGEVSCSPKNHQKCPKPSQRTAHACHGDSTSAEDIHEEMKLKKLPEGHGDLNMKHHHHYHHKHQTTHVCHGHSHIHEERNLKKLPEGHADQNVNHHHHHQIGPSKRTSTHCGSDFHKQGRHLDCQTCRMPDTCISIT